MILHRLPRRSFAALTLGGLAGLGLLVGAGGVASAASVSTTMSKTPDPSVTSVSPAIGPKAGGTTVTITGAHLTGITSARFDGTPGKHLDVQSDHKLTVQPPADATGTYRVRLIAAGRSSARSPHSLYTYVTTPTVSDIAPPAGPPAGGTSVTITGHGFTDATAVRFDGVNGTNFDVVSNSTITVDAPAHVADTVRVRVIKPGSSSEKSDAAQYTYAAPPTVTALSPSAGSTSGTNVTITGTGFDNVQDVYFGTARVSLYDPISSTEILAVVDGQPAGTVDVTVVTSGGTSATSSADEFTFVTPPSITSVSPSSGPTTGGTSVTITGTDFTDITGVKFDNTAASSFTVDTATQITAVSPAGSAGTANITLQTPTVSSNGTDAGDFTYFAVPTVTGADPDLGPTTGGTEVTITGTNFSDATSVSFGADPADSFTVDSSTQITAVTPAVDVAGTVDVTVSTDDATSATSLADSFVFFTPTSVTSLSPTSASSAGGDQVTVTGSGFTDAESVSFGTVETTDFTVDSDTQITVTTPAVAAGVVDLTVTTPFDTSSAVPFTFFDPPTVTGMSRHAGTVDGGDFLTIAGTGFTGTSAVSFQGTLAPSFTVESDTELSVTTPADDAGEVLVVVVTPNGNVAAGDFTFGAIPTVTDVSPNNGSHFGGTVVTITGTGFDDLSVLFMDGQSASYTVDSDTQITLVTRPHANGSVSLSLDSPYGNSFASHVFTYN